MTVTKHRPRHIVIRCHPDRESFNTAMATAYGEAVEEHGHEAIIRDLYAMNFDPVLKSAERPGMAFRQMSDVQEELEIIQGGDVFVLIYPIWFGGPPAMLKGYIERVLGTGAMPLQFKQEAAVGVLAHKRMISFTSSATDERWLATQGQLESLVSGFDRYIEHGFAMQVSQHFHFGSITSGMEPADIKRYIHEVKVRAQLLCMNMDRESEKIVDPSSLPWDAAAIVLWLLDGEEPGGMDQFNCDAKLHPPQCNPVPCWNLGQAVEHAGTKVTAMASGLGSKSEKPFFRQPTFFVRMISTGIMERENSLYCRRGPQLH